MEEGVSAAGNIEMAIASGTLPDLKHSKMAVKTPFTLSFIVSVPPERKKPFKKTLSMKEGLQCVIKLLVCLSCNVVHTFESEVWHWPVMDTPYLLYL
jgi:hypothetical protein